MELTSKIEQNRNDAADNSKHGSDLIKSPEPMPDTHLGKEKRLIIVTRPWEGIHAMPPVPRKEGNEARDLGHVDEGCGLALPVGHAADADLGEQQGEDGEDLDGLDLGGLDVFGCGAQEADEDDAGGEDEDDCALAEAVLGAEDGGGEAGDLDGEHLEVDAEADAQAVEVGVAGDGAGEGC